MRCDCGLHIGENASPNPPLPIHRPDGVDVSRPDLSAVLQRDPDEVPSIPRHEPAGDHPAGPFGNRRAGRDRRHERIALDLQLRDGNRENSTGDDPVPFDPLTGPEELGPHGRTVPFHEVERERYPRGLIRLRERRVELLRPWIACEDPGAERDVGDGESTEAGVGSAKALPQLLQIAGAS
jgi:hypothetical protein